MPTNDIQMPQPRFDQGRHSRAKLGFVLLATEQTIEDEMMRLCPAGVGVHFTRAPIPDRIAVDTLTSQFDTLTDAASLLLPDGTLDVCCYACTSGSAVMGEDAVRRALHAGAPNSKPTTLLSAVVDGLRALDVTRIALATPYVSPINDIEVRCLERQGFEVVSLAGLGLEKDSEMVRIEPSFLHELGRAVDNDDADALFISCGALRTLEIVDALEQDLGKPVVVSNQAMMWHCLRLAGIDDVLDAYGQLMKLPQARQRSDPA